MFNATTEKDFRRDQSINNRKRESSVLEHRGFSGSFGEPTEDKLRVEADRRRMLFGISLTHRLVKFASLLRPYRALLFILLLLLLEDVYHWRSNHVPRPLVPLDPPFQRGCRAFEPPTRRENATILMLARNQELEGAVVSIKSLEESFNKIHHYPVVFLNNEEWSEEFKRRLTEEVSGEAIFETISTGDWGFPEGTDVERARSEMDRQGRQDVKYGQLESYHHMCRYNSGRFYDQPALLKYRWYWRVEPNVQFTCTITYDPFTEMIKNGKRYGYVIALWELRNTVPTLWRHMDDFRVAKLLDSTSTIKPTALWNSMRTPSWIPWPLRSLNRFSPMHDETGDKWTACHFWSNFEIADMEFFRSPEYRELFAYLDATGNFYNERWGDAPVHSLAVSMLLQPAEIHHFADLGYVHDTLQHCPRNLRKAQFPDSKVLRKQVWDEETDDGVGCRCTCDPGKSTVQKYCLNKMRTAVDPRPY